MTPSTAGDIFAYLRDRGCFGQAENRSSLSACLPMLITALNWRGRVRQICEALPYKTTGIDIVDFVSVLANIGYSTTHVRARLDAVDERFLPCLYVPGLSDEHFEKAMVLLKETDRADGNLVAFCGATDTVVDVDPDELPGGSLYFFKKIDSEHAVEIKETAKASSTPWFRDMLGRFSGLFAHIFFTSVTLNVISLAPPLFLMLVYDKVIGGQSPQDLYYVLIGVVLAIATETALRYMRLRSVSWLGARIDYIVNVAILGRLLALPTMFTERASVAAQLARLKAFESVREFFSGPIFLLILELPFSLIVLAAIAFIAGPLAVIPIIVAGLYLILLLAFRPKLGAAIARAAKAGSAKQTLIIESLSKITALRYGGMGDTSFERLRELSGKASYASFQAAFLAAIVETVAQSMAVLAGVATIAYGVSLIWAGELTVGALIASMILVWRVLSPFQTVCAMLPRLEQLRNSIAQVNRLMALEPERDPFSTVAPSRQFKGKVTFSNVGLRYTKDSDPVFAGLSLDIEPGELVAITGSNGMGKSTILKLVNRLYAPQVGSIRIDGADIRQADPVELRRKIAYVPENPDFFEGTIAENLRLNDPLATDDALRRVLVQANAWEEISTLPDGLDTIIGQNGGNALASGLAYRLHLARAYLQESVIMLFDELPYAVLNSQEGEAFKTFLSASRGKRTVIFVTHRDDYVRMADKVIVLRKDTRPAVGTPEQVLAYGKVA